MKIYAANNQNEIEFYIGKDLWVLADIAERRAPVYVHITDRQGDRLTYEWILPDIVDGTASIADDNVDYELSFFFEREERLNDGDEVYDTCNINDVQVCHPVSVITTSDIADAVENYYGEYRGYYS